MTAGSRSKRPPTVFKPLDLRIPLPGGPKTIAIFTKIANSRGNRESLLIDFQEFRIGLLVALGILKDRRRKVGVTTTRDHV
jgi:hypothetical protein